jgi:MYXO-CTERM domain-containing protein
VTGDEDNTYVPGTPIGPVPPTEPDWPTDQIGPPYGPARDAGGCSVSGPGGPLPLSTPLLLIGLLIARRLRRRT